MPSVFSKTHSKFVHWNLSESPNLICYASPGSGLSNDLRWKIPFHNQFLYTEKVSKHPRSSFTSPKIENFMLNVNYFFSSLKSKQKYDELEMFAMWDEYEIFHTVFMKRRRSDREKTLERRWCNHEIVILCLTLTSFALFFRSEKTRSFSSKDFDSQDRFQGKKKGKSFRTVVKNIRQTGLCLNFSVWKHFKWTVESTNCEVFNNSKCQNSQKNVKNCAKIILVSFIL